MHTGLTTSALYSPNYISRPLDAVHNEIMVAFLGQDNLTPAFTSVSYSVYIPVSQITVLPQGISHIHYALDIMFVMVSHTCSPELLSHESNILIVARQISKHNVYCL